MQMILASYQVKSSNQIHLGETGTMIYDEDHPVEMVDKVKKKMEQKYGRYLIKDKDDMHKN